MRPINQSVLSLFSKKNNREWQEKGWPNSPLATYIDVDFEMTDVKLGFLSPWAEEVQAGTRNRDEIQFAIDSYFNVVGEINITLVARK